MNKEEIKELLEKLKQCDDFHNRCDFLMEHSEITYMLDCITKLQQENQELKEVIDTILNWDIFKNECPMNFGYDEETNENKAQDLFYKDDDYCENNCNDDYKKCWLKYFKRMHELERVMVKSDSNE